MSDKLETLTDGERFLLIISWLWENGEMCKMVISEMGRKK